MTREDGDRGHANLDALGEDLRERLTTELAPGEEVLHLLPGLGAAMVLTSDRVFVLREGGQARPRTGLRAYTIDQIRGVELVPPRFRAGRITLQLGELYWAGVSMFFDGQLQADAEELHAALRAMIARQRAAQRRRSQGGRGA